MFKREGVLKMMMMMRRRRRMIINSIHVLLFLCKYIAMGSKQFKGLLHPHDRPQHLNFRRELC
jgi:hypothetical protein